MDLCKGRETAELSCHCWGSWSMLTLGSKDVLWQLPHLKLWPHQHLKLFFFSMMPSHVLPLINSFHYYFWASVLYVSPKHLPNWKISLKIMKSATIMVCRSLQSAFTSVISFGLYKSQLGTVLPLLRWGNERHRGQGFATGYIWHMSQSHNQEPSELLHTCHPLHMTISCQVQHHQKQVYLAIVKRMAYLCLLISALRDIRMEELLKNGFCRWCHVLYHGSGGCTELHNGALIKSGNDSFLEAPPLYDSGLELAKRGTCVGIVGQKVRAVTRFGRFSHQTQWWSETEVPGIFQLIGSLPASPPAPISYCWPG